MIEFLNDKKRLKRLRILGIAMAILFAASFASFANAAPTIDSVSDSPDPQAAGSNITFSSTASGDTIKLYVCKDSSCVDCNSTTQTGCWAYSTAGSATNPSASYTCLTCGSSGGARNYWAKVCDQAGVCSSIVEGGSWSCEEVPSCNVEDWAWSENIGWISFSSKNQATDYLASWNSTSGDMSGYAWSDNIGWLSFNCADNNVCSTTNQFCAIDADCPGGETCVDSRDGCDLVSNYKVTINTTTGVLSGYAWSDSVGWLSFNASDQKACSNNNAQYCVQDSECGTGNYCNFSKEPPALPYNGTEDYIAKKVSTKLTGWARFLSATGISGWDGWLKFSCYLADCDTSDYSTYFSGTNIGGWAWGSDVIGWLSFGGTSAIDYGLNISSVDNSLSGYAWSENLGWLSFQKANTGTPPAAPFNDASQDYIAKLDNSNCKFRGWAKFLSAGAGSSGWDGWVKLQREGGTPDYYVSLNSANSEFEGWAWAGSPSVSEGVVGWLAVNDKSDGTTGPIDYQVTTTLTGVCGPSCSNTSESWAYCADSRHPVLNWTCSQTQTGRQIQIKGKGAAADCVSVDFSTGLLENVSDSSASQSYTTTYNFSWNTTYCWRVKCQAASGWSSWAVDSDGFTTPQKAYPAPDFAWSPLTIRTNEFASFYDDVNYSASAYSKCYNSSDEIISCGSRTWTFEGATNCCRCSDGTCADTTCLDGTEGQPETYDTCTEQGVSADPVGVKWKTRPSDGRADVSLQVCDATQTTYCCTKSRTDANGIPVMRYPKWREIIPW